MAVTGVRWSETSFLALLDEQQRQQMLAAGSVADYLPRQAIVREQDQSDFVTVILAGRVCISRFVAAGREAMLAIRGPGELVGELSAILDDGDGRSATVVALDPVRVHLLTRTAFLELINREPAVMFAVVRHLAHRLRAESARAELSTGSSMSRVARLLVQRSVDAASRVASGGRAGVEVGAGLSQASIADLTGMSRESVVRALHRLRSEGSIHTGRQSIRILDLSSLAAHAVDAG